jgi:putative chitinase
MTDLLTVDQLHAIMPEMPRLRAETWAPALSQAMSEWGIASPQARAAFLAVCGEESGYFRARRERLNYSAEGLAATFKRFRERDAAGNPIKDAVGHYVPTAEAETLAVEGERAIANVVYANAAMGNVDPSDGFDFRGGCPIQITFRSTWAECARAQGFAHMTRDELVAWAEEASNNPEHAAKCSAWFFTTYKPRIVPLVETGEQGDFLAACRHVGIPPSDRVTQLWLALWKRGKAVLA